MATTSFNKSFYVNEEKAEEFLKELNKDFDKPKRKNKKDKIEYNYKTTNYLLLLYPDNKQHMEALSKIQDGYPFIGILHDKDEVEKTEYIDNFERPEEDVPSLKKEHYHIVLHFDNSRYKQSIIDDLGIEPRFLKKCANYKSSLFYLIHYNHTDKFPYEVKNCFGPLVKDLEKALNKVNKEEDDIFIELLNYIDEQAKKLTLNQFTRYACEKGYYSYVRRSSHIFTNLIKEHNEELQKRHWHPLDSVKDLEIKQLQEEKQNLEAILNFGDPV